MKLNRLETHDRLLHFKKDQEANVFQGAEDCLKKNPLSLALQDRCHYIYMFAHPRTCEDGVTKKMFWQPRLTKPEPQTNSYLFRAISKTDEVEICWLLPPSDMWNQYRQGNITESDLVLWSINEFQTNRKNLGKPDHDDLTEKKVKSIYKQILGEKEKKDVVYE
jgi:hypothetical protein